MKTFKTIVLLSAIGFSSLSAQSFEIDHNNSDTVNQIDNKGKKQGKWITYGGIENFMGYGFIQKVEEGEYNNGKKVGVWKEYSNSGKCKSTITYQKGIPNGNVGINNELGEVSENGIWMKDHWVGKYKSYYINGCLKYEFIFNKRGKRTGIQKYYHENGNVSKECYFNDGFEMGTFKEFYQNGNLKSEIIYNNGKFISVKSEYQEVNYLGTK